MGLTDLDNVLEITKRVWKEWNKDHLQGTLLAFFVSIFAKWWYKPDVDTLYALLVLGGTLIGVTAIKFLAKHLGNTQQFKKYMQEGQRAKDIAETHFQMDLSLKMADNLIILYTTLIADLEYIFEDGEVTPAEAKMFFRTMKTTFTSMGKLLGKTSDTMSLVFSDFVDKHFRKPFEKGEEPTKDNIPTSEEKSEMLNLAESLESGDSSLLKAAEVVDTITDLNPTDNELTEDTKSLQ